MTKNNQITQIVYTYVKNVAHIALQICEMQHRGEIIEEAIRASGISISLVARKINRSRRWIYLLFENPNVSLDYMLQIGNIIHHDFSDQIPELKRKIDTDTKAIKQEDIQYWQKKYYDLLESYNKLLEKQLNTTRE